jgi:hypothetical protein
VKEIIMPTKATKDDDKNSENDKPKTETVTTTSSGNPPQLNEQPAPETVGDKSVAELANDVLHGRFGDFNVVRENLDKAGADTTAVLTLVNDRLAHGAPSSYRPNISQVLESAKLGEWGDKNHALRIRGAGYSEADALHVESQLNQES